MNMNILNNKALRDKLDSISQDIKTYINTNAFITDNLMYTNISHTNDNLQPHGFWKYHYANGSKMYEGNYNNGKHIGIWKWYNINDELSNKYFFI